VLFQFPAQLIWVIKFKQIIFPFEYNGNNVVNLASIKHQLSGNNATSLYHYHINQGLIVHNSKIIELEPCFSFGLVTLYSRNL
jgi:hypothetical protein